MIAPGQDCVVTAGHVACWSALGADLATMVPEPDLASKGARATYIGPYVYGNMEGWHVLLVVADSGRPLYVPLRDDQFVTKADRMMGTEP